MFYFMSPGKEKPAEAGLMRLVFAANEGRLGHS